MGNGSQIRYLRSNIYQITNVENLVKIGPLDRCGVMTAWSRKTWKVYGFFFWKNDPLR